MKKLMTTCLLMVIAALLGVTGCADDGGDDAGEDTAGGDQEILAENMIDDLEDGDDAISDQGGRSGDWYTFNDGTAGEQAPDPFVPEEGGPEGSQYAVHTTGSGWTEWGSGVGFDFNGADPEDADAVKGAVDGSAFTGIAFHGMGPGEVRVSVATLDVIAVEEGGQCVPGEGDGEECSNAHGQLVTLTDGWAQYSLPFEELSQDEGWGQVIAFDVTNLGSMFWETGPNVEYDYWIDNVGFY